MSTDIPDIKVKISVCQKCNGMIRIAVEHMMDKKSKKKFLNEVMENNLAVKTVPLLEYRKNKMKWCECK